MRRWLVIAIAVGGLSFASIIDRRMSGVESGDVREAAAKLESVPAAFGAWTSTEVPIPEKILRVAEAAGHVSRTYSNRKNGARVGVLLLCGPTGPIGAHEPQYCYAGNGFDMSGEPQTKDIAVPGGETATYWTVLFEKRSELSEHPIRVCWMWSAGGAWKASTDPRTEYALRRALYKLYVTRSEPRLAGGAPRSPAVATDSIVDFLTDFLPEVNKALAAPVTAPK
jgi:hypothetical protein